MGSESGAKDHISDTTTEEAVREPVAPESYNDGKLPVYTSMEDFPPLESMKKSNAFNDNVREVTLTVKQQVKLPVEKKEYGSLKEEEVDILTKKLQHAIAKLEVEITDLINLQEARRNIRTQHDCTQPIESKTKAKASLSKLLKMVIPGTGMGIFEENDHYIRFVKNINVDASTRLPVVSVASYTTKTKSRFSKEGQKGKKEKGEEAKSVEKNEEEKEEQPVERTPAPKKSVERASVNSEPLLPKNMYKFLEVEEPKRKSRRKVVNNEAVEVKTVQKSQRQKNSNQSMVDDEIQSVVDWIQSEAKVEKVQPRSYTRYTLPKSYTLPICVAILLLIMVVLAFFYKA